MGSSESTARSNGTEKEEERRQENSSSGEASMGAGTAIAIAAAGAAVVALGISKMLSGSTDTERQEKVEPMTFKAPVMEPYLLNSRTIGNRGDESKHRSIWSPPRRYKMNTDGACRPHQGPSGYGGIHPDDGVQRGPSGYGGILRDDTGKWVRGFRGFIGVTDSLTAEFHGIHEGLKLLNKLGLKESILESDCEAAVKWVNRDDDDPGNSQIIRDCWEMIKESRDLRRDNHITINHIHGRNGNKYADKLADMAIDRREVHIDIISLPDEINDNSL